MNKTALQVRIVQELITDDSCREMETKLNRCGPSSVRSIAPVARSQNRISLSCLDIDISSLPFGENATVQSLSMCSRVCTSAPVFASQIRTLLSFDAVASRRPFGENATLLIRPLYASIIYNSTPQCISTFDSLLIQEGISCSNSARTKLISGANTRAEQYV